MSNTLDDNKMEVSYKEGNEELDQQSGAIVETADEAASRRKTIRKIDVRLLIILGLIYAVSLIDRSSISVARVLGMSTDLGLNVGNRYSVITLIFFVPYIIFELPSNLLLKVTGPRLLICTCCLLWGCVMIGMAFVNTWQQLLVTRILLGCLEGLLPSCIFLISTWFTRFETQKRLTAFYTTSLFISGFSNIISYGFSKLEGRGGLRGWRWIFLLYGIITVVLAVTAWLFVVDFPQRAKFLTDSERAWVIDRINKERGDGVSDDLTTKKVVKHLLDIRHWGFGMLVMNASMPAYAFAFFLPVILQGGGYSTTQSLLLSAPPYVLSAFYSFTYQSIAYLSDKTRLRAPFMAWNALLVVVGLLLMAYVKPLGVRYLGTFFVVSGCQTNITAGITYQANNITSHSRRGVASAIMVTCGGVGGLSRLWSASHREQDYPRYIPGLWATIACQLFTLALLVAFTAYFFVKNRAADQGTPILKSHPSWRYTY